MFRSKLKTVFSDLTSSEKAVADYIIDNIDNLKTITSHELAKKINIGQSTIIRFSQKLGYSSFRELLSDLSAEPRNDIKREEISVDESMDQTNRKILSQYHDITDITFNNNPISTIENVVSKLVHASKIVIFGIGSSNLFCEYLANQLIKMGFNCQTSNTPHTIFSIIAQADQDTVLFVISETGETPDVLKAAKIAKENNVYVIAMTRGSKNSLHNLTDCVLKTVAFETTTRLNITTMRCSQLLIIDMIYLNILKSNFKQYQKIITQSETLAGIIKVK